MKSVQTLFKQGLLQERGKRLLKIKNITIRNFMSVGNVTQAVNLERDNLTLVLGNNVDLGGDGSRNGTGKTTLINALSYGLYGNALTNIRKDNLINKTNAKNMLVTIDFEYNGSQYRIERGRRPNVFRLMRDGIDLNESVDEAQGEMRQTQTEVVPKKKTLFVMGKYAGDVKQDQNIDPDLVE